MWQGNRKYPVSIIKHFSKIVIAYMFKLVVSYS